MSFTVVDVKRPIQSVSRLNHRCIETYHPMFLALVDAKCDVEAQGTPAEADEELETEWVEKRVHRQWHTSIRVLRNHPVRSRDIMDSLTFRTIGVKFVTPPQSIFAPFFSRMKIVAG